VTRAWIARDEKARAANPPDRGMLAKYKVVIDLDRRRDAA